MDESKQNFYIKISEEIIGKENTKILAKDCSEAESDQEVFEIATKHIEKLFDHLKPEELKKMVAPEMAFTNWIIYFIKEGNSLEEIKRSSTALKSRI